MSQNDEVFIKLAFNQRISVSQKQKVIEFWKFCMSVGHLKPFVIPPDKKPLQEEDTVEEPSKLIRTMWHDQLKVFHEHGLDKAALAATETCKLCETNDNNICMEFADTVQQPYEELLDDMRTFDEKLNEKTENGAKIDRKISSIL